MTHNVVYRYLGINGVVQTPVFIEGANGLKVNVLIADAGKMLTDGKQQNIKFLYPIRMQINGKKLMLNLGQDR